MKNGLVEYDDGTKRWFVNNQLHRTDGPAIERADGTKCWWVNGTQHREDGPAIERADGTKCWWVNGSHHSTSKSFQQAANLTDEEMMMLVLKYGDVS